MRICKDCSQEFDDATLFCRVDGQVLKDGIVLKGKYAIEERIGLGGMGFVYRAKHRQLGHTVAIKILKPELSLHDVDSRNRFEREAKVIANLEHDNIVKVVDFDYESSYAFFVMNYLEGITLQQKIKQSGQLTLDEVSSIFSQICAAIAYAHEKGIVHRDLKPANVILLVTRDSRDRVKVLDFGVAKILDPEETKITRTLSIIGTPAYMSPEQFNADEAIDGRSDIYSMGVILYEMICGKVPFEASSPFNLGYMHVNTSPRSLSESGRLVAQQLENVVHRALAKRPEDRQQTVEELATALDHAIRLSATDLEVETLVMRQTPVAQTIPGTTTTINTDNSKGKNEVKNVNTEGGSATFNFNRK